MKTVRFIFRKILYPTCAFFTLIWFVVCIIIDSIQDVVNFNLASSSMCFVIALCLALCNLVLEREKIPFVGRFFLHMVLSIVSISVTIALFAGAFETAYPLSTRSFYLVLLLIAVYLVIATPLLLLYNRFVLRARRKKESESDYSSIFRKK